MLDFIYYLFMIVIAPLLLFVPLVIALNALIKRGDDDEH